MTHLFSGITYVIPCGAGKLDHAAPAAELYTGTMFRHTYENVAKMAAGDRAAGHEVRILILSALHGLLEVDQVVEPYELKMGAAGSVTAERIREQATALGMGWGDDDEGPGEVYALLPRPYLRVLDEALRELYVYVQDVYEGCSGIGEQRRVNVHVGRAYDVPVVPVAPAEDGLQLWIGGDVPALWWGMPVLLSHLRLRRAKTLPVASAPWVCDSGGFNEIITHGRWTITVQEYADALNRYAQQIGNLRWAAPQDWPASAVALAKTGLTERQHQEYTIAAYTALVKLTDVPIIPVLTGTTPGGYLRHLAMWKAAGFDLTVMDAVVGVGALVKRPPAEAADIVRALHAAGVRRMHGFGLKGPVLDLVGPLLESVDSAGWSDEARRDAEEACPHGLVKFERNCRVYAQRWAGEQMHRANRAHVQEMLPVG